MSLPEIKLKPVIVETSIGAISANFDSVGFFRWFSDGDKAAKWADARSMLRAALAERGRLGDATDPAGGVVDGLSDDEVEAVARQVLAQTEALFAPLDGEGAEAPSEILRRRMRTATTQMLERLNETVRQIAPDFRALASQLREIAPALEIARQQYPLALRMMRDNPTLKLIESFRGARPEYMRIAEAARLSLSNTQSALSQVQRLLSAEQLIAPRSRAFSTQHLVRQYALNFPSYQIATQAIESGLLLRGYQLTAFAGLEGIAGRGAAADVLSAYGEPATKEAPIFSSVRGAIADLDLDEVPASRIETWLQDIWEAARKILSAGAKDIQKSGVVALLALLVSVIALSQQMGEDQTTSDDVRHVEEAVRELTGNLEAIERELREERLEDRAIRYLAEDAWLRAAPARDGLRLRRVYPDQIVRVIDESGNWLKVEIYDYRGEAPIVGWMNRRVLRVRAPD